MTREGQLSRHSWRTEKTPASDSFRGQLDLTRVGSLGLSVSENIDRVENNIFHYISETADKVGKVLFAFIVVEDVGNRPSQDFLVLIYGSL